MYQELIESLKANLPVIDISSADIVLADIDELKAMRATLTDELALETSSLVKMQGVDLYQVSKSYAISEGSEYVTQVLTEEVDRALSINTEFDIPSYAGRLLEAVLSPDAFLIDVGVGDKVIDIDNNMDQVAGRIEEWGNAIKSARSKHDDPSYPRILGDHYPSPAMASHFWAEKYYGTAREGKAVTRTYKKDGNGHKAGETVDLSAKYSAKYWETMQNRLNACSSLAPFWEIVDQGTISAKRGLGGSGKAYPQNQPTNFVKHIQDRLKSIYNPLYVEAHNNLVDLMDKFETTIESNIAKINVDIRDIDNSLSGLSSIPEGIDGAKKVAAIEIIDNRLMERAGIDISQIKDPEKASKIVISMLSGNPDLIDYSKKITVATGKRLRLQQVYNTLQVLLKENE